MTTFNPETDIEELVVDPFQYPHPELYCGPEGFGELEIMAIKLNELVEKHNQLVLGINAIAERFMKSGGSQ